MCQLSIKLIISIKYRIEKSGRQSTYFIIKLSFSMFANTLPIKSYFKASMLGQQGLLVTACFMWHC